MLDRSPHFKLMIELETSGNLGALVQGSVISTSVLLHYKIARRMEELIKRRPLTQRYALVMSVCEEFSVGKTTVYKAMQTFNII